MANQAQEILDMLNKQVDVLNYRQYDGALMTVDALIEYAAKDWRVYDADCPFHGNSHTKNFCGYDRCPEG